MTMATSRAGQNRQKYDEFDDEEMWKFLYNQVRKENPDALLPNGLKIWKLAEEKRITDKTFQSMQTHFRRQLLESILTAPLEKDQLRFLIVKWRKCFPPENFEMMLKMLDEDGDDGQVSRTRAPNAMGRIAQHPSGIMRPHTRNVDDGGGQRKADESHTPDENNSGDDDGNERSARTRTFDVNSNAVSMVRSNKESAADSLSMQHNSSASARRPGKQKRKDYTPQQAVFSKIPRIADDDETIRNEGGDVSQSTTIDGVNHQVENVIVGGGGRCYPELYFETSSDSYAVEWDLYRFRMCEIIDPKHKRGGLSTDVKQEAAKLVKESEEVLRLSRQFGLSFHRVLRMITNNCDKFADTNTLIRTLDAVRRSVVRQT